MQLLHTILSYVTLALLSFPIALTSPTPEPLPTPSPSPPLFPCSSLPKFYSTLPYNFSLQIRLPRDPPGSGLDYYSIRLQFQVKSSDSGWDYAILVPEEIVGNVFSLKNRQLIPPGGSSPAYILGSYRGQRRAIIFNGGRDFARDVTFKAKLDCDKRGKQFLSLVGDIYKGPFSLAGPPDRQELFLGPAPPPGVTDFGGLIVKIIPLTYKQSQKNIQITNQGDRNAFGDEDTT